MLPSSYKKSAIVYGDVIEMSRTEFELIASLEPSSEERLSIRWYLLLCATRKSGFALNSEKGGELKGPLTMCCLVMVAIRSMQ